MLRELLAIIKESLIRLFQSRLFALGILLCALFGVLTVRLFQLQIVNSEVYHSQILDRTKKTVTTPGTRGNIYDADGNLLAYNKLSYNVTISDNGAYENDYNARNLMLYRLALILEKHNVPVVSKFEVTLQEDGSFTFTSSSDSARRRFLANAYGIAASRLDDASGKYPSNASAKDIFDRMVNYYAFNELVDENGKAIVPSDKTLLDMISILFTMRQTAFQKYETTTIAQDINEDCMAELLENQGELQGTDVEETYIRRYNNAKYFSHIIGYTGAVQDDKQLAELQKTNPDYAITDIVGATGLEKTMETALQGTKGTKELYVDSFGKILETISETAPKAGDNFYLTIQQNLQIGIYHLLEQQLASILANKIVNQHAEEIQKVQKASDIVISVDDAYFQLINNNVLHAEQFHSPDAGSAEQAIAAAFDQHKSDVLAQVQAQLLQPNAAAMQDLSTEIQAYMVYIYDFLSKDSTGIVRTSQIDQQSESYLAWKNDTISLRDYLYSGISAGWIDTSGLSADGSSTSGYENADDLYQQIVSFVMAHINHDTDFDKLIYRHMIIARTQITGRLLCMALYEQGVLQDDAGLYGQLSAGDETTAYQFLIDRILSIDITPAQLALDPCMGSVVVTDVNTGEIRALVTYPGYDNNRINDPAYFQACLQDLSLPLINSATQTNKAPGSTFKPISAVAVLEEGKISPLETVDCTGIYKEVTPFIRCWLGPPGHGPLTVQQAIENSCNYSFAEYGHRLSMTTDETGAEVYSPAQGIATLQKYASMFGLDRKSGIQIDEKEPHISDSDPERSAFGQSTHSFNNVQLARYTVALANSGKLFDLTLLQKETDADGNEKQTFAAKETGKIEISQTTWDTVHAGLRDVITQGVAARVFNGYSTVEIAGKTGTAEETKTRANHGYFISYAPYQNPEVAVNVMIPFSYSSGNSASLARRVYDYYYGKVDLPTIVSQTARGIGIVNVSDG